jgi:dolichyl-phosphate beta-glucosyltransferase
MPAKDEERRLGAALARLLDYAAGLGFPVEIIVVDDGSTDRTAELAREAAARALRQAQGATGRVSLRLLRHERNRGKGAAVRTGALAANGDYVLYLDADGATPPEETPKLLRELDAGADVAIGSRVLPGGGDMRASQPAWRRMGGRLFALARRRLILADVQDTQCGFKAFRREVARDLFSRQRLEGWSFDAELLFLAQRLGYTVRQAPVEWRHVGDSIFERQLGIRSALREVCDLLRIRWLHGRVRREGDSGPA